MKRCSKQYSHMNILPLKLTWPLKIGHPKGTFIFQPSIFRCYVSFREGIFVLFFYATKTVIFHNYISHHFGETIYTGILQGAGYFLLKQSLPTFFSLLFVLRHRRWHHYNQTSSPAILSSMLWQRVVNGNVRCKQTDMERRGCCLWEMEWWPKHSGRIALRWISSPGCSGLTRMAADWCAAGYTCINMAGHYYPLLLHKRFGESFEMGISCPVLADGGVLANKADSACIQC